MADIMDKLTGPPSASRPDVFSDTSPAELLPLGVQQVHVNGTRDRVAPLVLGRDFAAKARVAGDDADYIRVPSTGHVELISPDTEAFDIEIAMLKRLLGLTPPEAD